MKKKRSLTLQDAAHFVIYRELDKLGIHNPYDKASQICRELRAVVEYRAPARKKP